MIFFHVCFCSDTPTNYEFIEHSDQKMISKEKILKAPHPQASKGVATTEGLETARFGPQGILGGWRFWEMLNSLQKPWGICRNFCRNLYGRRSFFLFLKRLQEVFFPVGLIRYQKVFLLSSFPKPLDEAIGIGVELTTCCHEIRPLYIPPKHNP